MRVLICDFCDDALATWVVDKDTTHGGNGEPEWDAPVLRVACNACKVEHGSSYLEPEVLTDKWVRYFARPWVFYAPPHA